MSSKKIEIKYDAIVLHQTLPTGKREPGNLTRRFMSVVSESYDIGRAFVSGRARSTKRKERARLPEMR